MTTIRRVRDEDGDVLRTVRLAALADSPFAFGSTLEREAAWGSDVWTERTTSKSAGPGGFTAFAEQDGTVVGLATGYREKPPPAAPLLVAMWVCAPARGTGAAALLVQSVLDWAQASGDDAVELWVVEGNERAQRCYERLGFARTGTTLPVPGRDDVQYEMRCSLAGRRNSDVGARDQVDAGT